jgi:tetratricopeptide (TPR) repeat protein
MRQPYSQHPSKSADLAAHQQQDIVIGSMNIGRTIEMAVQNHQRGNLGEAEALCRRVLASEPNNADALYWLGAIAHQTGRVDMAIGYIQRAIQVRPLMAEAHYNLGTALREVGCVEQAIDSFRKALELQPEFVDAANDLGSALRQAGRMDEAVAVLRQTVRQAPRFYKAHNNLGNALRALGRFDEAEAALRAALRLRDDVAEIHVNLGNVLCDKGQLAGAIAATRQAIRLRPDLADAHQNLGSALLLAGDYAEGWREHEWRWRCQNAVHLRCVSGRPQWDGSNLGGRTILLQADAGFGDAIHFVRYIPMVADRGGQVVLECPKQLHRLLGNLRGVRQLITAQDPLPSFEVHCPLMSLPLAFNTTIETIPSKVPYLMPEESLVRQWAHRLSECRRPRVGLVWAGNPGSNYRKRSLSLSMLAPLSAAGDITFYSLQLGDAARQVLAPPHGMKVIDHSRELIDFAETAALTANLDLVIAVDTAVAHLAGALGKAVWVMLPFAPDWRWMLERADSPWYPSMRLFRQTTFGDWDQVVQRVARELEKLRS